MITPLQHPISMNLELTTKCPLHCPQCYVSLNTGREMDREIALSRIRDAAEAGVEMINLSGGETLCYPHLNDLIRECAAHGLSASVALSGAYVNRETLQGMIDAGVDCIYVSINGSTEEINRKTRDGYALAIHALQLLQEMKFPRVFINWVMHRCNADDFPQMLALAEKYGVYALIVIGFKPDAHNQIPEYPSLEQMKAVADQVKRWEGKVNVGVECCFSPLRALQMDSFLGNKNRGLMKGCGAGIYAMSVNVDGFFTPCRHLDFPESYPTIMEYWQNSPTLAKLREAFDKPEGLCAGCRYERYCGPCFATNYKMEGALAKRMNICPIGKSQQ